MVLYFIVFLQFWKTGKRQLEAVLFLFWHCVSHLTSCFMQFVHVCNIFLNIFYFIYCFFFCDLIFSNCYNKF